MVRSIALTMCRNALFHLFFFKFSFLTRLKRGPMERKAMELLCYGCKKTTNIEHGSTKRKKRNTNKGKRLSHRARACTFSFIYLHYFTLFHRVCKII
jgi:hypothetical protein